MKKERVSFAMVPVCVIISLDYTRGTGENGYKGVKEMIGSGKTS